MSGDDRGGGAPPPSERARAAIGRGRGPSSKGAEIVRYAGHGGPRAVAEQRAPGPPPSPPGPNGRGPGGGDGGGDGGSGPPPRAA